MRQQHSQICIQVGFDPPPSLLRHGRSRRANERAEQPARRRSDVLYCAVERPLVDTGRHPIATDLSHELKRCRPNFFLSGKTHGTPQSLDASAHVYHLITFSDAVRPIDQGCRGSARLQRGHAILENVRGFIVILNEVKSR